MQEGTFSDIAPADTPWIPSPPIVFEDDHGRFQYSLADEAPSFESRGFASAVAAREMQRSGVRA